MFPRWRLAGLVISALLFLAAMFFWVRSYFYDGDGLTYVDAQRSLLIELASQHGGVDVAITNYSNLPRSVQGNFWRSYSSPLYQGWRFLTVRSLLDFGYKNGIHQIPLGNPAGTIIKYHVWSIRVPTWSIVFLSALFPAWCFLHGNRKNLRWLRKDLSWNDPRLRARIGRFAVFSTVGALAGSLMAWAAIKFPMWQSDWIWIAPWTLLPVVCLMAVYTRRRLPWYRAMLWMALDFAGCVCFFQAAIQQIWSHYRIYSFEIEDSLQSVLLTGIFCFLVGAVLLVFTQVKPEPAKPGPYCPECGYCLIGLPRQICSECGRPFTLEELGVEPDGLKATARPA